ncbi:MAG: CHASE domain-containing protein, partial [Synergistaceae bacterium]|nr:CHASE domain-containing protein [Synergistaceae bacterium]
MKQFPRTADRKRNFQGLLMITLIAVLAAGVFAGWMSMREEDGYMRSEILRQARLFAETVNIGGIRTLKGDATDLSRPEYRRLKDQFTAAAGIFRGSRFLYLIGRRPGGDVFFYLDSERPGSEDESPPGQVYPESDPRFLPVFEENRPVATGPVSDRWGTWISAWYPVVDPASGAAAAAIGIDFDAEYWRQAVREAAILPNIVAALLAAMIYAGFITIKGRETMEEDTKLGFRHAEAVLVLYLGILVSLVTAQFMHGQDLKRQRESFESLSDAYSTELNIRIHRVFGQSLRALGGFIEASDLITRDEFHVFAGYFSNAPGVESALWIPAVSRKDRISFEKSAGSEYGRKFFIRDRNGEGGFSPAGDRQNYFPILYSWPDVPAENIIRGIDPSSD